MDAFDGSEPEDSQATQMLQDLLAHDSSPSKPSETRSSLLKNQFIQSHEISSDSLPSSRTSHSVPQYHFHGLASTQTQSQSQHYAHEEDVDVNEGSQKENIGAAKAGKEVGRSIPSPVPRSASPHASSSRNVTAKALPGSSSSAVNDKGKKTSNVTFQSPRPKTRASTSPMKPVTRQSPHKPTVLSTRYKPIPRSRSRASSQDSFACDPDNNNEEELFVAKSEQFAVPLSELGKDFPGRNPSGVTGGTSGSSLMSYPRTGRQPVVSSPPRGRVLVEATPSQSSQSFSQDEHRSVSQRIQETQILDTQILDDTNIPPDNQDASGSGYESSQPHSSVERFYRGEAEEEPLIVGPMETTQPSTQLDHAEEMDRTNHYKELQSILSMVPTTTSTRSGPKSLLAMVRPENRHRYRELGNASNVVPSSSVLQQQTQPEGDSERSLGPETQPSFPEAPPPRRGFPPRQPAQKQPSPIPAVIDSMEVVPDSEPPAPPEPTSPKKRAAGPSKIAPTPTTIAKKRKVENDVEMKPVDRLLPAVPEESDYEEDEVPLAVAAVKRLRGRPPRKKNDPKGKGKATLAKPSVPPTPQVAAQCKGKAVGKSAQKPAAQKSAMAAPTNYANRSWETGVVPSSVPEQDIVRDSRTMRNRPTIIHAPTKKPAQKPPQSRQSTRSTSGAPRSHLKQEKDESSDDEALAGRADKDNNTELADEEYQDPDNEDDGDHSRKRKRAGTVVQSVRGTANKRTKRTTATPGPGPRTTQIKNLRSAASATAQTIGAEGTRVFALWTQDGHYYPGTAHSSDNGARYNIKFDDGTESWVAITEMRLCELRIGDDVLFDSRNRPAKVVNVDSGNDGFVKVNADNKIQELPISDLRIANKTILYAWTDRTISPEEVTTTIKPVRKHLSPSPSKMSMVSVPSVRGNRKKVLAKTGLIITLSAASGNWEKEKEKLMNAVKNSGGFVIDDLSTVIKMDGKHAKENHRWSLKKNNVQWIGNDDIERLFLVADDPNQKPKFLMALALGIPCLTTNWLYDSVECGEEKEWAGYMLPQGYSATLQARPSQQVDVDWGNSIHQLKDIMANSVASKLFAGKTVLCVGHEMVCQPKGKRRAGTDEKTQEASNAVPRIILAMGAEVVEAVTETRYASKNLADYDYIVIRESSQYLHEYRDCKTVHWSWVKECLIASRHLALPSWVDEHSQEA